MFRKLTALILAALLMALPATNLSAEDNRLHEGYFTYTVENGKATITDYSLQGPKNVVIPDKLGGYSVAIIGNSSFCNKQLTSVIIGNTVEKIGFSAFGGNKITSVKLGNSIKTIDMYAFNINKITSLVIPDSVIALGQDAFSENQIASLKLGKGLKTIGGNAFFVNRIASVAIPGSVTSIGDGAFRGNVLSTVTIPNGIRYSGRLSFADNRLISVNLPKSLNYIEFGAFSNNQIIKVTIPDNVVEIGDSAFNGNKLTSVVIPNSVKRIGEFAFFDNQLTSVAIGSGVSTIASTAFGKNKLSSITIPYNVSYIDYSAFDMNQTNPASLKLRGIPGSPVETYSKQRGYTFVPMSGQLKTPASWAAPELAKAQEYDLVPDNLMWDYDANITREEFSRLAVKLYEKLSNKEIFADPTTAYVDTYEPEIVKAKTLGISGGVTPDRFEPYNNLTREQLAVMLYNTIKAVNPALVSGEYSTSYADNTSISPWARNAMAFMSEKGIIGGVGGNMVNPQGFASREQSIAMVKRTFEMIKAQNLGN